MMFRMIAWDADALAKLKEAADQAVSEHREWFILDLNRKHRDVRFNTIEALDIINQLEALFRGAPQVRYPENREGREP